MKKKKIIISLLVLGVLIILIITTLFKEMKKAGVEAREGFSKLLSLETVMTSEDSAIFPLQYRRIIKVNVVHRSKVRNNISLIHFNDKYNIVMYKINMNNEVFNLQQAVEIQQHYLSDKTTGYTYNILEDDLNYKFEYFNDAPPTASKITMILHGEEIQPIISNDSILSYHLLCRNLAIKYPEARADDIFIDSREGFLGKRVEIPMDFMLLKRQKFVYLIVMTPMDFDKSITPGILYKIISGTL